MKCQSICIFIFALFISRGGFAGPAGEVNFEKYLTISEENKFDKKNNIELSNPLLEVSLFLKTVSTSLVSLLKWDYFNQPLPAPTEPYNRTEQFGSWIDDPRDESCLNTRAKVLVRDSLEPVQFSSKNPCSVTKGQWYDKANGEVFESAKEVDVDHFVPLKNAYLSGGWQWKPSVKCMYANFMGNKFHLVPMSGEENRKKSDQTPQGYMPKEKSHRCEYLRQWLLVKAIWRLALNPEEAQAIQTYIQEENCDPRQFTVSYQAIKEQRQFVIDNLTMCER